MEVFIWVKFRIHNIRQEMKMLKSQYKEAGEEEQECNILIDPPESEAQFDMSELQLKEVREVVHKARASSAPGPSSTSVPNS